MVLEHPGCLESQLVPQVAILDDFFVKNVIRFLDITGRSGLNAERNVR